MNKNSTVYISGALTGIANPEATKAFYESIGLLCEKMGFNAYVPHLHTDPVNNPDVTPQQVFETDKKMVSQADLVIVYMGQPSFGVGMEIAYAEMNQIPTILVYEEGKTISRFPRGIPSKIGEVVFKTHEDALQKLREILETSLINVPVPR